MWKRKSVNPWNGFEQCGHVLLLPLGMLDLLSSQ